MVCSAAVLTLTFLAACLVSGTAAQERPPTIVPVSEGNCYCIYWCVAEAGHAMLWQQGETGVGESHSCTHTCRTDGTVMPLTIPCTAVGGRVLLHAAGRCTSHQANHVAFALRLPLACLPAALGARASPAPPSWTRAKLASLVKRPSGAAWTSLPGKPSLQLWQIQAAPALTLFTHPASQATSATSFWEVLAPEQVGSSQPAACFCTHQASSSGTSL